MLSPDGYWLTAAVLISNWRNVNVSATVSKFLVVAKNKTRTDIKDRTTAWRYRGFKALHMSTRVLNPVRWRLWGVGNMTKTCNSAVLIGLS